MFQMVWNVKKVKKNWVFLATDFSAVDHLTADFVLDRKPFMSPTTLILCNFLWEVVFIP